MHPILRESCDEAMACAQIEFDQKQAKESSNGQHEAVAVGMCDRPEGSEANYGKTIQGQLPETVLGYPEGYRGIRPLWPGLGSANTFLAFRALRG